MKKYVQYGHLCRTRYTEPIEDTGERIEEILKELDINDVLVIKVIEMIEENYEKTKKKDM